MSINTFCRHFIKLSNCNIYNLERKRLYSRWSHRRPSKVLLQQLPSTGSSLKTEEIFDLDSEALRISRENHANKTRKDSVKENTQHLSKDSIRQLVPQDLDSPNSKETQKKSESSLINSEKIKKRRQESLKLLKQTIAEQKVFDENGEIIYDKLGINNGKVSTLLTHLKSKKGRIRLNQVLVEGWRLIVDGLKAKCHLDYIIFSQKKDLDPILPYLPKTGVKLYKIPYKEIQLWSNVDTSSGILGVFKMPQPDMIEGSGHHLPLNIICDNVRDPGNLGAILRACVGVGCDKMLLMKGCVDLWDPKVVRSAAGAHFRLPVHCSTEWSDIETLIERDTSVIIADNKLKVLLYGGAEELDNLNVPVVPYYSVDYNAMESITLIIGGETEGISIDSYKLAANRKGLRVNIPLQRGVDSLNTGMATAVIAFEIKKQMLQAGARARGHVQTAVQGNV